MPIGDLIKQVAKNWPGYQQKGRVDKTDPTHALVTKHFPEELEKHITDYNSLTAHGSTGAGNITAAPWIALFDRRLTTSATNGYYIVYLFSTDLSTVTLCIAFGTTQFEEQFGSPKLAFPRMRTAAARLQEMFNHLIPSHLVRGSIDLAASPSQKLHFAYQQASILSYPPYQIGALPDEKRLIIDLQELARIYTDIVSDPLEATVERLVEAVAEPSTQSPTFEVKDFVLRQRQDRKMPTSSGGRKLPYSPESRKVGDAGEKAVVLYERERLMKIGRKDLAERVNWHASKQEFVGWDITSFDDDGNEIYIEVKSSIGSGPSSVNLTVNEWDAARDMKKRERYYIYIVTKALSSSPSIERLKDPASYVDKKELTCEPIVYELRFK